MRTGAVGELGGIAAGAQYLCEATTDHERRIWLDGGAGGVLREAPCSGPLLMNIDILDIFDLSVLSIWGGAVDCLPVPANTVLCFVGRFWQTEKQKAQLYLVNFYKSQLDKAQSNYSRPKNPSLSSHLSFVLLTQKPFTIPTLTLDDLAHLLDVSPDELLEEIIARKYQSFEEFIHFHRIEEARVLIDSMELDSIDDVFYKVGFTSKNYFNLIFEEVTGLKSEYYIKNVVKG